MQSQGEAALAEFVQVSRTELWSLSPKQLCPGASGCGSIEAVLALQYKGNSFHLLQS